MGHIDHGKTTLLDYIRKSSVAASEAGPPSIAAGEAGGITQHIGAYEVDHGGKMMTFLDTPGHEAFGKMRSRGARVADIAILVVAADDGVRPQTKEALETIKGAGIPFAVAINKIDKPAADPEKTKNELAELQVFLEGRGGTVPFAEISAKQGSGVDKLLETVLLLAELEDITADPKTFASGVVIESHRDPRRGITSTLLIINGTMKKGEYVAAGEALAKVKILENFKGESIDSASPSQPAVVVGFDKLPPVGAEFKTFFSQKEAMEAARRTKEKKEGGKMRDALSPGGEPVAIPANIRLGIVIKTDVLGSAEAIEHEIAKLKNDRLEIKILRAEAGDISEDDVKMAASSTKPLIIAFKSRVAASTRELAERMNVEIAEFEIIYDITDFFKKKIESILPKEVNRVILGHAKILKIFPAKGAVKGQIVGGKIIDGVLKRDAAFELFRRGKKIGEGAIENLQQGRISVPEIAADNEFGALISAKTTAADGDELEVFSAQGGSASGGE
ncbi:translation initiation factor IF-2 [Candidatus Giovannonibacteria bacterium RIFCSPHIGHO2_12_FULL_45_19]|nr:MAG: translation initiation factor IF-2 [Candidatus Giovannonibacteria bacterium RIFCSPHIGHO2_12_FULL_45_19]